MIKLIIIALTTIVIASCSVNQNELNQAYKVCENHGGLYKINIDTTNVHAMCKDGHYEFNVGE